MRIGLLAAGVLAAVLAAGPAGAEVARLTVLHTNDTHTHFRPSDPAGEWGGVARLATLLAAIRAEGGETLLLDAGDWSEGTVFHFAGGSGSLELQFKAALAYDAVTIGNHDYLYSPGFLASKLTLAAPPFPVLAANVDASAYPALDGLLRPHMMWTRGALDVGVFGLTTDEFIYTDFFDPVLVTDPAAAAEVQAADLRGLGADLVICLSHLGLAADLELAAGVAGIDVIVGGHSHDRLETPIEVAGPGGRSVRIVQAGDWYRFLGRLDLEVDLEQATVALLGSELIPVFDLAPDPALQAQVDAAVALAEAAYGPVFDDAVATAAIDLPALNAECRLGNLAADSFLAAARTAGLSADAAITTGNFVADGLAAGPVHSADVIEVCPYGFDPLTGRANTLVSAGLTGLTLKLAFYLAFSAGQTIHAAGVTGITDPAAGIGGFYRELAVGGAPVVDNTVYRIAMNSTELATLQMNGIVVSGVETSEVECWRALRERIAAAGTLDPDAAPLDGRIRTWPPDLHVLPEEIAVLRDGTGAGQGAIVAARIRNLGELAAAGGEVRFFFEATPEDPTDDPTRSEATRIGVFPLSHVHPYGDPGQNWAWAVWDTTGLGPSPRYRIYVSIEGVVGPGGEAEAITANNFAASPSTGLALAADPPALGVMLYMPPFGLAGDTCGLEAVLTNPGPARPDVPLFVILDVYGSYYFGPGFAAYDPDDPATLDSWLVDLPAGVSSVQVLPPFAWPDTGGQHASGLYFHAAMLSEDLTEIAGDWDSLEFGF